jgi:hypothetical protein
VPTINTYRAVSGDPERSAALDRDFLAFLTSADERAPGAATSTWHAEYLLVTARKNS